MSNILTVFGATGNQGGSVIKTILADPVLSKKWKIRGVTRDTSKPAAKELAASNVEMVSVRVLSPFAFPLHLTLPCGVRWRIVIAPLPQLTPELIS